MILKFIKQRWFYSKPQPLKQVCKRAGAMAPARRHLLASSFDLQVSTAPLIPATSHSRAGAESGQRGKQLKGWCLSRGSILRGRYNTSSP
jgi:hypothetical protein